MFKRYRKILYILFFSVIISCFLFCAPAGKILAKLEAPYPTVAGHTLTEDSKLPDFAIYLYSAGMSLGFAVVFLSLVWAGILYFLSPLSAGIRASAKDRVVGAISGLLILILTYLIITTINPDLKTFRFTPLPAATIQPLPEKKIASVSFYDKAGCGETSQLNIYSVSDLADLKNKVVSVGITKDENASYIVILYDNINFWGKCLYLDPNDPCPSATDPYKGGPFADSVSINKYDFNPGGDGVYFYRKSYFNESGGWFKVNNNDIKNGGGSGDIYSERLDDLHFIDDKNGCNVPEEEQDCVKYDKNGKCTERSCPSLGNKNISSIKIKGDYIVLLTYAGPGESCDDTMAESCQEFPALDDINKIGPQQIKWDHIRTEGVLVNKTASQQIRIGAIPNCVTIIPIKY